MCYRTGKYTVYRRLRGSFSPEILQARTVKGLIEKRVHVLFLLQICPAPIRATPTPTPTPPPLTSQPLSTPTQTPAPTPSPAPPTQWAVPGFLSSTPTV